MRGCLRVSSYIVGLSLAAALGAACSPHRLVVVDPDPLPPGLLADLVGYWRLDEAAASTVAQDWPERRNDGTLVGLDPATSWIAAGRAAGALSVQARGFVNVEWSPSIESITDQVTLAAWVYLEGVIGDWGTTISRQIGTSLEQHYHLTIDPDDHVATFITTDGGLWYLESVSVVARQTWVHLACTYDGAAVRLYIDGEQVAQMPAFGMFRTDTTPVILGGNGNNASDRTELFPGRLDEIMLYRRGLSADEIGQIYGGALFLSAGAADAAARN